MHVNIARGSPRRVNSPAQPTPVIDLTGDSDDEELQKALSLSVSPHIDGDINGPDVASSFRKSERTDVDQSWALVPVSSQNNDPGVAMTQDDDLQRAMEASLNSSYNEHSDEPWVPGRTRLDRTWSVTRYSLFTSFRAHSIDGLAVILTQTARCPYGLHQSRSTLPTVGCNMLLFLFKPSMLFPNCVTG